MCFPPQCAKVNHQQKDFHKGKGPWGELEVCVSELVCALLHKYTVCVSVHQY